MKFSQFSIKRFKSFNLWIYLIVILIVSSNSWFIPDRIQVIDQNNKNFFIRGNLPIKNKVFLYFVQCVPERSNFFKRLWVNCKLLDLCFFDVSLIFIASLNIIWIKFFKLIFYFSVLSKHLSEFYRTYKFIRLYYLLDETHWFLFTL